MENTNPYPAMQTARPAGKPKKERYEINAGDMVFAGILTALTLFLVIAGVWGGFRLGYAVSFSMLIAGIGAYLAAAKRRRSVFGVSCGAFALLLSPVFALTSNEAVRFCAFLAGGALAVIGLRALAGRTIPGGDLGLAVFTLRGAEDALGGLPKTLTSVFSGNNPKMKGFSKAALGVLCAVPVLCAVVPLLVSSDAAFDGLIGSLLGDLGTVVAQLLFSLVLLPFLLSFAVTLRKKQAQDGMQPRQAKGFDAGFFTAFLSVLGAVYAAYLFSQLAYFFSAFRGLLPAGYENDYAAYARRGFFELCGVAAINLGILFLTVILSRKKENGKMPAALRGLGTFIVAFTLVIIGTALAKMILYIRNYGMTVLRVGTSAFMIFMAVVFLAILLRLYTARVRILHVCAVAAALTVAALGICNLNAVAAKYNYEAFRDGRLEKIDTEYLQQLGPEGIPYLLTLCEDETLDPALRDDAAKAVFYACAPLYESEFDYGIGDGTFVFTEPVVRNAGKLSQWNLPQQKAYEAAEAFFDRHPDFLRRESTLLAKDPAVGAGYYSMAYDEEHSTQPAAKE